MDDSKAVKELAAVLAATEDKELIEDFLKSLLTPNEMHEVATRWALVKLINEGMSQRKIAEKLGLSLCKITRGSKELKKEKSSFKSMIDLDSSLQN
ncbi:MAG: Trp family transcriptional regulator [Spirochaetales bacterium]|nr:Trp family transcriptional regulator [Spirochaetales bacterium]